MDTDILIYHFEASTQYSPLTDAIFRWLENPAHRAITSTITMTGILVEPAVARDGSADDLYGLLSTYPHLEWCPPDLRIASLAAEHRAKYRMKTMNALQAATAECSHAECMVTNDAGFRRIEGLRVLVLDDYA